MFALIQQQGAFALAGFAFVLLISLWALHRLQRSLPSPVNRLIVRWVRLIGIGLFIGLLFKVTFFAETPFWRLYVMGVLFWLFVESGYVWIYILAWDKSELPLFPSIREVERVEWPANHRFFLIKDWIREHHYSLQACFQYRYEEEVLQQVLVYQSEDALTRLQVIIVSDASGVILDQVVFASVSDSGELWVTDNVFMPFGGVYPETWRVQRHPAVRKISKIASMHERRKQQADSENWIPFEVQVSDWLFDMQQTLERVNVNAGILNERTDRDEFGKMTGEGRYRIWKELLLLNYLAISPFNC